MAKILTAVSYVYAVKHSYYVLYKYENKYAASRFTKTASVDTVQMYSGRLTTVRINNILTLSLLLYSQPWYCQGCP